MVLRFGSFVLTGALMDTSSVDIPEIAFAESGPARRAHAPLLVLDPASPTGLAPILLDRAQVSLGWDVECSVQLPEAGVAARHAQIVRDKQRTIVKAWDSRTRVNGHAIHEAMLHEGDVLTIGPHEFHVRRAYA